MFITFKLLSCARKSFNFTSNLLVRQCSLCVSHPDPNVYSVMKSTYSKNCFNTFSYFLFHIFHKNIIQHKSQAETPVVKLEQVSMSSWFYK